MTQTCVLAAFLAAAPADAGPALDSLTAAARNTRSDTGTQTFDHGGFSPATSLPVDSRVGEREGPQPYAFTPPPRPPVEEAAPKRLPVKRFVDGVQAMSSAGGLWGALSTIPLFGAVLGPAAYAVGAVVAVGLGAVMVQTTYSLFKLVF